MAQMKRFLYYLRSIIRILKGMQNPSIKRQVLELAKSEGYDSVHVIPKRYKGKKKYKKVPRIHT